VRNVEYVYSVFLPILLLILAMWFIRKNYRSYVINWRKEITAKKVFYYSGPVLIKSIVSMLLIIVIHNYAHSDHALELILFILLYIALAIFQSAYSFGGFLSRMKYIFTYTVKMFNTKSQEAEDFKNRVLDSTFNKYKFLVRIVIIMSFIFVFIPNISLFVVSNIVYFLIILSLLLLSLALNNLIYFGLIALMIFQFAPVEIAFGEVNYLVLTLSFLVIVIGNVIETRMDNRMFRMVANRAVKTLNFSSGYTTVYYTKKIVVYQQKTNHYYYIYYRLTGIVIIFESMFDAKLTDFIVRKMIFKGTQYLKLHDKK
jgi:hypothetical protein